MNGWRNSLRILVVAVTALALGGVFHVPVAAPASGDIPAFSAAQERASALVARTDHECRVPLPAAGAKDRTGAVPVFASLARMPAPGRFDRPGVLRGRALDHRPTRLVGVVELRI